MKYRIPACLAALFGGLYSLNAATVSLEELDLAAMSAGWGKPRTNLSITDKPLSIGGEKFGRGVGTHADSELLIALDGQAQSFTARVGVDDNAGSDSASLEFGVFGDGRELWRSGICKWKEPPYRVPADAA